MKQKQTTNSLTVEVTAYLSINLNGTWELIGFEPDSLTKVAEPSPKQTTLDDGMSPIGRMFKRIEEWEKLNPDKVKRIAKRNHYSATKALSRAQENPRHYSNRPKRHNWGNTVRKIQRCSVCGMKGVNKLTCLAHLNAGERKQRQPTGWQFQPKTGNMEWVA